MPDTKYISEFKLKTTIKATHYVVLLDTDEPLKADQNQIMTVADYYKYIIDNNGKFKTSFMPATEWANIANKPTSDVEDIDIAAGIPSITLDPTGFVEPENVIVTYDKTTKKVTLTGTVIAYWRGARISVLENNWESPAIPVEPHVPHYLYYDGSNFTWSENVWTFDKLQICYVFYLSDGTFLFGLRETHGLMPWQAHEHFHRAIGTVKQSGGALSGYILNSTTATERRPNNDAVVLKDEDLKTINTLRLGANYTHCYLTSSGIFTSDFDNAEIVKVSTAQPYYNQYIGGVWQQTLMTNNNYMCVWVISFPVTADADSQRFKFIYLQGQSEGDLVSQQKLTPSDLNLANLSNISPEFVFLNKIIIRYVAANWQIVEVSNISGNKISQLSMPTESVLEYTLGTGGFFTTIDAAVAAGVKKVTLISNITSATSPTILNDLEIINTLGSGYYIDFGENNFTIADGKTFTLTNCHIKYANGNVLNDPNNNAKYLIFKGECQITNQSTSGTYTFSGTYRGTKLSFETLTYNTPNLTGNQAFCSSNFTIKGNKYIINIGGTNCKSTETIGFLSEINFVEITGTCSYAGTNYEHLFIYGRVNDVFSSVNNASISIGYANSSVTSPRVNLTGTNTNIVLNNRDFSDFYCTTLQINSSNVKSISNGTCSNFFNDYTAALRVNFTNVRFTKTTGTFNIYSAGCNFTRCFFGSAVKIWKSTNATGYGKDNTFDNCTFGVSGNNLLITIASDTYNITFIKNKIFGNLSVAGANHDINFNRIGETANGTKTIILEPGCINTNVLGNTVEKNTSPLITDNSGQTSNNIQNTQSF